MEKPETTSEAPAAAEAAGLTAGDLMVSDIVQARSTDSAAACLHGLQGIAPRRASVVAVVEGDRVAGLVPLERLTTAGAGATLGALMIDPPEAVAPATPIESAAARMVHRGEPAVLVAGLGGELLGVVPPARLTEVLLAEHEEDMARLGGYRAGSRSALRAAEEPLKKRLEHRLPWLIVGLAGAMLSVLIVGSFEEQLNEVVLLAFFVPAVVYMADSVGTQTETLLIRALAADVHLGAVVRKELLTGLLLGLVVAGVFFPFALIGWGNESVALAVSVALFCSCSIATAVAMGLPIGLQRLGFDPAFGSGPLATVIQDLLSIAIYFAIGVPLAT